MALEPSGTYYLGRTVPCTCKSSKNVINFCRSTRARRYLHLRRQHSQLHRCHGRRGGRRGLRPYRGRRRRGRTAARAPGCSSRRACAPSPEINESLQPPARSAEGGEPEAAHPDSRRAEELSGHYRMTFLVGFNLFLTPFSIWLQNTVISLQYFDFLL